MCYAEGKKNTGTLSKIKSFLGSKKMGLFIILTFGVFIFIFFHNKVKYNYLI